MSEVPLKKTGSIPEVKRFNPPQMGEPLGLYKQIARARGSETVFIAGQLAADRAGNVVGKGDFEAQMKQVFANIATALDSVGGSFANVAKFTTYLVHSQDIERFMQVRKQLFATYFPNGDFPPNTLLIVDRLVQEEFLIEVETTAML
jgi:enamine deaminase RidA (YjgF/YER057c/UK114 family)